MKTKEKWNEGEGRGGLGGRGGEAISQRGREGSKGKGIKIRYERRKKKGYISKTEKQKGQGGRERKK